MRKSKTLKSGDRGYLLEALHTKYARSSSLRTRFIYYRKKYSWLIIVYGAWFIKRTIDIFFSLTALIVLSPLIAIVSGIIKLTDGGPIFYVTDRVGKWGKEFRFPKFRSMYYGADVDKKNLSDKNVHKKDFKTFKMKEDPRITEIGKFIRKYSIDEIPQFWCVLKGDMSLVGPRPPLPEEVDLYSLEERRRLDVTPGLTCIWQVSGRSEIPFAKQLKLDMQYIESHSFWGDVKILLKTIPAVLFGRGAY